VSDTKDSLLFIAIQSAIIFPISSHLPQTDVKKCQVLPAQAVVTLWERNFEFREHHSFIMISEQICLIFALERDIIASGTR
jgi:hypothetical protein